MSEDNLPNGIFTSSNKDIKVIDINEDNSPQEFVDLPKMLEGIDSAVNLAFEMRQKQTSIPGVSNTKEQMEVAENIAKQMDKFNDDDLLQFNSSKLNIAPGEIFIDNPHLYPFLLKSALKRMGFSQEQTEELAKESFDHELDHGVPILGHETAKVYFGIRFFENKTGIGLTPIAQFSGFMTKGEYKDVISAPDDLSDSDKVASVE